MPMHLEKVIVNIQSQMLITGMIMAAICQKQPRTKVWRVFEHAENSDCLLNAKAMSVCNRNFQAHQIPNTEK